MSIPIRALVAEASSGLDLWKDFGIQELVCVTPPGGIISPNSSLMPASMGKAPGRLNQTGQWAGYPWRNHFPTIEEVKQWDRWGANIGVHASHWPAFDLDVEDEDLAQEILKVITRSMGTEVLIRRSRSPRLLVAFKAAIPGAITKKVLAFKLRNQEHKIELLGAGQQWVAVGTHPSGCPYVLQRVRL